MVESVAYLAMAGGVPYYLLLERKGLMSPSQIFLFSALLLLCAVGLSQVVPVDPAPPLVLIAFASAMLTLYRALKTTNFYKLGYHLVFFNAPFFMRFEADGAAYGLSLLAALLGLYLIARFYEKHYGSANYHYITGMTLATPSIAAFLLIYLIALALYPPFPNALFFLNALFHSRPDALWLVVAATLFFGNFTLAMRVMMKTLFGRPNPNIHYVHMNTRDTLMHFMVLLLLLGLGIGGFREVLI